MPEEYVFTGLLINSSNSAKCTISLYFSWIFFLVNPKMIPFINIFSLPEISG